MEILISMLIITTASVVGYVVGGINKEDFRGNRKLSPFKYGPDVIKRG